MVSTAQHLTDLALELAKRGHQVTVIASDRGYDSPSVRFSRRERWNGITIVRIGSLSLGKKTKWRRALNFGSFLLNCSARLLLLPRFDRVIALTSPPLISVLGALFSRIKGGRFYLWVMDLNPDEAIAAGWLNERSLVSRALKRLLRQSLTHAARIIVLDDFMKTRILATGIPESRISVIPPWAHDNSIQFDERGRKEFRERHRLTDSFVVMYSGNHSPCHPLDTLLNAALRLSNRSDVEFCFVGGGSEQEKVRGFAERHYLENITCLPYQPLEQLSGSLSAADLHVVGMGDAFTGIVHPCKVYNILSIGSPFLYIGPRRSHITEIVSQSDNGLAFYGARHGEVDLVVAHIIEAINKRSLHVQSNLVLAGKFARQKLLSEMIELIENDSESSLPEPQ